MKVPLFKEQADSPIQRLDPPAEVRLTLNGLAPTAAEGDSVEAGGLVARSRIGTQGCRVLHSPLTGEIQSIRDGNMIIAGRWIEPRPATDPCGIETLALPGIAARARDAGLVGMGGAMYPTYLKLADDRPLDWVIINGCESEPYLSADHRVIAEYRDEVESGMRLAMRAVGAERGRIVTQKDGYLSGYDRFLVKEALGREVPPGGVPHDVGVVVLNVQTARALHHAVLARRPLVDRVITVAGGAFRRRGNFLVPIGTRVGHILDVCGCDVRRAAAIILGGPMMGVEADADTPITAGTGGVVALTRDQVSADEDAVCIRCGLCFEECPVGLAAGWLAQRPTSDVRRCIECGICQFACPAKRPLVSMMRAAKATWAGGGDGKP